MGKTWCKVAIADQTLAEVPCPTLNEEPTPKTTIANSLRALGRPALVLLPDVASNMRLIVKGSRSHRQVGRRDGPDPNDPTTPNHSTFKNA